MRILFQSNQLSIRGTEIALYDYARYNEEVLGNQSLVCYEKNNSNNNPAAIERFSKRFETLAYTSFTEVDPLIRQYQADLFYAIKGGGRDGVVSAVVPSLIHAVFPVKPKAIHGSAYAFVSDWLARVSSNNRYPAVPHIVSLPNIDGDLRRELNIPADATVFGCHGGAGSFDIDFAKRCVQRVAEQRPDIFFVFLNIAPFTQHPQVIFLPASADIEYKVRFINSCDAMLHARKRGESFGLACGEFSVRNKPVITYSRSGERNHIEVLADKALLYGGEQSLSALLLGFDRIWAMAQSWDCYSERFSPETVMRRFHESFIVPALAIGASDHPAEQMTWTDRSKRLGYKAEMRLIKWSRAFAR